MDFQLSAEQREMVSTVRALAQEKFKPRVKKWQDGTFPFENIKDLARKSMAVWDCPYSTALSCSRRSPRSATSRRWR
jgi:alkylation response protein AidB-like acyl-CoA dehydrogenase